MARATDCEITVIKLNLVSPGIPGNNEITNNKVTQTLIVQFVLASLLD